MTSTDVEKQLAELEKITGEILGKLSVRAKPWREISTEELKMVNSLIALGKKVSQLLEKCPKN